MLGAFVIYTCFSILRNKQDTTMLSDGVVRVFLLVS